jgi:Fe-S cluster assembly protein SufD
MSQREALQYFPLKDLQALTFGAATGFDASHESFIYPECAGSTIVFVNGVFSKTLSRIPNRVVALPLDEAMKSYGTFLKSRLAKLQGEESDPFVQKNLENMQGGLFFYVPPKLTLAEPIQCLNLITEPNVSVFPRVHLLAGAHSEVQWIVRTVQHESSWSASLFDIGVEEGANLHVTYVTDKRGWQTEALRATVKQNGALTAAIVSEGSVGTRFDGKVSLNGEGSRVDLRGLSLLDEQRHFHAHLLVEHVAPHAQSMQRFKNVLKGTSRASFQGKILVRSEAQKTEAYQMCNHLLLNEGAIANSKPNLEIFADDVKASHGATVAQLRDDELFYLQARGLSAEAAKHLLIDAFCKEILDEIPHASIRNSFGAR